MVGSTSGELDAALSNRHAYLLALLQQPRSKSELEDEVDGSRSTLDRALRELAEADFVRYENGVWTPTLLGRCSYQIRETYLDRLNELAEAAPVLNKLPFDSPLGRTFLAESDVYEANSSMPDAVMRVVLESVERATEVCIATPALVAGFVEKFYSRVTASETYSVEMVLSPDLIEQVQTAFPKFTDELTDDPNVTVYRASISFTYGIWLVDSSKVGVIVFTNHGIRGIIVNETEEAIEWAKNQYGCVKRDAEPVDPLGKAESTQDT